MEMGDSTENTPTQEEVLRDDGDDSLGADASISRQRALEPNGLVLCSDDASIEPYEDLEENDSVTGFDLQESPYPAVFLMTLQETKVQDDAMVRISNYLDEMSAIEEGNIPISPLSVVHEHCNDSSSLSIGPPPLYHHDPRDRTSTGSCTAATWSFTDRENGGSISNCTSPMSEVMLHRRGFYQGREPRAAGDVSPQTNPFEIREGKTLTWQNVSLHVVRSCVRNRVVLRHFLCVCVCACVCVTKAMFSSHMCVYRSIAFCLGFCRKVPVSARKK
jgi:hypothetical protein